MDDLAVLREINYTLMALEHSTAPEAELSQPLLLVVGPPRSGTTLITQYLAYGFMAGYITNIAARFWNAPTLGVRVSRQTLGDDPAGDLGTGFFRSNRGQTPYGGGIHEFGYFWKNLCWESPALHQLAQIQNLLGKPLVMKGIYAAHHAAKVRDMLGPHVHFIAVERPFSDLLTSVAEICRDSGESDFWFRGWELPSGKETLIENLLPIERIAARLYFWVRFSARVADIRIHLPNVCSAPNTSLRALGRVVDGIDEYREIQHDWMPYRAYDEGDYDFLISDAFKDVVSELCRGFV